MNNINMRKNWNLPCFSAKKNPAIGESSGVGRDKRPGA